MCMFAACTENASIDSNEHCLGVVPYLGRPFATIFGVESIVETEN